MPKLAGHRNAAAAKSALSLLFGHLRRAGERVLVAPARVVGPGYHAGDLDRIAGAVGGLGDPEGAPAAAAPESITTHLKAPDGTQVATAKFEFNNGYATITIETTGRRSALRPASTGCTSTRWASASPTRSRPTGGAPGDFLSAGGHFQAPGHTAEPASGDLTSLQVRKDGAGDAGDHHGRVHHGRPAGRRRRPRSSFTPVPTTSPTSRRIATTRSTGHRAPTQMTMSTGDAGKRVACGVIGAG